MPGDTPIPLDYADGFTGTGITFHQYGPEWVVRIGGRLRSNGYKAWLIVATTVVVGSLLFAVCEPGFKHFGDCIGLAGRFVAFIILGEMFFLPSKKAVEISPSFVTIVGAKNPMRRFYWEQKRYRIPRSVLYDVKYSTISECLTFRARNRDMVEMRLFVAPAVGEALASWMRQTLDMASPMPASDAVDATRPA